MSIPASHIVQINPGVVGTGGNALNLNGLILTNAWQVPIGSVRPFPDVTSVSDWFGASSIETAMAQVYFAGRNNATVKPASLLFTQYNTSPVGAYLLSANFTSLSDAQLLSGVLTITVDGVSATSATINLSGATSLTDVATIINSAFTGVNFLVGYDAVLKVFTFSSTTTGLSSTITFASGTLAAGLTLTQATGASISQGAIAATPSGVMDSVILASQNWATFTTTFEPVLADKLLFSLWNNGQNNRYAYVAWDTDVAATVIPDTTSFMYNVRQSNYSGTVAVYQDKLHAAFVLGVTASLDFSRHNGRTDYAFKYTDGLLASVTDATTASNLEANGYNYIGQFATANQGFTFFYRGSVSGEYKFLDSYIDQIYLNSQIQLALLSLLTSVNSIPYNSAGYASIHASTMDPINQMLNYGGIVGGVPLSSAQKSNVNNAAGVVIDDVLSSRGWFLQIMPATAQVRGQRGSPPITLWYMDGGSVQKITMASIVVL